MKLSDEFDIRGTALCIPWWKLFLMAPHILQLRVSLKILGLLKQGYETLKSFSNVPWYEESIDFNPYFKANPGSLKLELKVRVLALHSLHA